MNPMVALAVGAGAGFLAHLWWRRFEQRRAETRFMRLWTELKGRYGRLRAMSLDYSGESVPETTNDEVREIADMWKGELERVNTAEGTTLIERLVELRSRATKADATETYPCNWDFWMTTREIAAHLDARGEKAGGRLPGAIIVSILGVAVALLGGALLFARGS